MASPEAEEIFDIAEFVRGIEKDRAERASRPRTFELAGETFTHKPSVPMEVMANYFDMTTARIEVDNQEAIKIIDATILGFLEPGQEEKWHKVRHDAQNPVTYSDAHSLIEGLLRSLSGRPTGESSDSTDGQKNGTTSLTASSSSEEPTSNS